jgi:hypothetical protein
MRKYEDKLDASKWTVIDEATLRAKVLPTSLKYDVKFAVGDIKNTGTVNIPTCHIPKPLHDLCPDF